MDDEKHRFLNIAQNNIYEIEGRFIDICLPFGKIRCQMESETMNAPTQYFFEAYNSVKQLITALKSENTRDNKPRFMPPPPFEPLTEEEKESFRDFINFLSEK